MNSNSTAEGAGAGADPSVMNSNPHSKRRKYQQYQPSKHSKQSQDEMRIFKLSHLPLRPSTLSLLTRKGFHSTADVHVSIGARASRGGASASGGGISNFASELEISLVDAVNISQEIEKAAASVSMGTTTSSTGDKDQGNDYTIYSANKEQTHTFTFRRPPQTAAQILSSYYSNTATTPSSSSTSLYPSHSQCRPIITFVRSIDSLLGGGFHPKEIIEIAGCPGVGKTQLAMQVCVDACLPRQFGGCGCGGVMGQGGCNSVYIDAEGSFSPERCSDMAQALVNHVHQKCNKKHASSNHQHLLDSFSVDSILDSIHVFRVYDETCQTSTIYSLPDFLKNKKEEGKDVKVVVIDSIAFHYRSSSSSGGSGSSNTDYKSRTKSLTSIAAFLSDLANRFDLTVLIINQMTTKVSGGNIGAGEGEKLNTDDDDITATVSTDESSSRNVVAALGESWAHSTTSRILLKFDNHVEQYSAGGGFGGTRTWCSNSDNHSSSIKKYQEQRRICKLIKSPHRPAGLAYFTVTEFGLRDCIL